MEHKTYIARFVLHIAVKTIFHYIQISVLPQPSKVKHFNKYFTYLLFLPYFELKTTMYILCNSNYMSNLLVLFVTINQITYILMETSPKDYVDTLDSDNSLEFDNSMDFEEFWNYHVYENSKDSKDAPKIVTDYELLGRALTILKFKKITYTSQISTYQLKPNYFKKQCSSSSFFLT